MGKEWKWIEKLKIMAMELVLIFARTETKVFLILYGIMQMLFYL